MITFIMSVKAKIQNIAGLVIPSEWDDGGRPVEIKICAPDEVDYFVIENKKGKRLYKFLQQFVKVTGVVKLKGSKKLIEIKSLNKEEL